VLPSFADEFDILVITESHLDNSIQNDDIELSTLILVIPTLSSVINRFVCELLKLGFLLYNRNPIWHLMLIIVLYSHMEKIFKSFLKTA
jgi:hypothetical protein